MRGLHRRWNRRTLDHQSSTPVIHCSGNPLVTNGFIAHKDNNVINYWMTNNITVTLSEFHEFSTHLHLHCLFNSSFGQTWKKTPKLRFVCDEDWNKWRHHTLGQQCGNLSSSINIPPAMRNALIKLHSSALLIVWKGITLVFVEITHKTTGQSTFGMHVFNTINIRNSFQHIYVY